MAALDSESADLPTQVIPPLRVTLTRTLILTLVPNPNPEANPDPAPGPLLTPTITSRRMHVTLLVITHACGDRSLVITPARSGWRARWPRRASRSPSPPSRTRSLSSSAPPRSCPRSRPSAASPPSASPLTSCCRRDPPWRLTMALSTMALLTMAPLTYGATYSTMAVAAYVLVQFMVYGHVVAPCHRESSALVAGILSIALHMPMPMAMPMHMPMPMPSSRARLAWQISYP